jgi:hypothetical protein
VYEHSKRVFDASGHEPIRSYSHEYREETPLQTWGPILVDGDHRYAPALWDMPHWFKRLRPDGINIADDCANPDTPDGTRAVNRFIELNGVWILRRDIQNFHFRTRSSMSPFH